MKNMRTGVKMKQGGCMEKIRIISSTLRDGSHAICHQFTKKNIRDYCRGAEKAGIDTVIVGHGDGIGGSSFQVGFSKLTDKEMVDEARKELKNTKLGVFLLPGFGTIKMLEELDVDSVMIASHCTEANVTRQHMKYAKSRDLEVFGCLMMAHRVDAQKLLRQAIKMANYGADNILFMDSAGAILPDGAWGRAWGLNFLPIPVGYHAHNNLGMATASSLQAVKAGATFLDCTSRGLGAGAGNCPLEVIVAILHKEGYETGLDLYKLMDNADLVKKIMDEHNHIQEISMTSLSSGLAGIFSGFKDHVLRVSKEYNVDPRKIFEKLGELKAVAGQEDLIVDVAKELQKGKV